MDKSGKDLIVMYHSLLIGASLFVPIPFFDERLAVYFWKRMITQLAKRHQKTLTPEQVRTLSYQFTFKFSDGCLFVTRRIFRELSQELLVFLEWRKAFTLAADAYYSGYLIDALFAYEKFDPANVAQYAVALQTAKKGFDMDLMKRVFKGTFQSGKGTMMAVVKWLSGMALGFIKGSRFRRKRNAVSEQEMNQFFEENESGLDRLMKELRTHFENGLGGVSTQHFEELRVKFFGEVERLENPPGETISTTQA